MMDIYLIFYNRNRVGGGMEAGFDDPITQINKK